MRAVLTPSASAPAPVPALVAIALSLVAPALLVFPWLVDARDPALYGSIASGFVLGFIAAILGVFAARRARTLGIAAVVIGALVMLLALVEIVFIAFVDTVKWH
jgi:hypothetical protein